MHSRRHSFPELFHLGNAGVTIGFQNVKSASIIPPIPDSPVLQAMRLPSITDTAVLSTWRLSFAAPNRGEQLRKLSQEFRPALKNDSAVAMVASSGSSATVRPRPTNRWLHSQGLRSSSQVLSDSEEPPNLECLSPTYSGNEEFGGVDGSPDTSSTVHLHEMAISQRLASSGIASNESLSNPGSRTKRLDFQSSSGSRLTQVTQIQSSTSQPLSERTPDSWGKVREYTGSSVYKSGSGLQVTPTISKLDMLSAFGSKDELVESEGQ